MRALCDQWASNTHLASGWLWGPEPVLCFSGHQCPLCERQGVCSPHEETGRARPLPWSLCLTGLNLMPLAKTGHCLLASCPGRRGCGSGGNPQRAMPTEGIWTSWVLQRPTSVPQAQSGSEIICLPGCRRAPRHFAQDRLLSVMEREEAVSMSVDTPEMPLLPTLSLAHGSEPCRQ